MVLFRSLPARALGVAGVFLFALGCELRSSRGRVSFGGVPVPGATVTVTQGTIRRFWL